MGKRRFRLNFFMFSEYVSSAVIELDDAVIEAVDDEWRAQFYNLHTPERIAEHIGFNLIVNRRPLSDLDGWADQPDENARVIEFIEWLEGWDVEAAEVTDED